MDSDKTAAATPLYQQVYSSLRAAVLSGEMKLGTKVPSTRALAEQLNVSHHFGVHRVLPRPAEMAKAIG